MEYKDYEIEVEFNNGTKALLSGEVAVQKDFIRTIKFNPNKYRLVEVGEYHIGIEKIETITTIEIKGTLTEEERSKLFRSTTSDDIRIDGIKLSDKIAKKNENITKYDGLTANIEVHDVDFLKAIEKELLRNIRVTIQKGEKIKCIKKQY